MSSPKWHQNNGFPLKRIHSSDKLRDFVDNDHVNDDKKEGAFDDIWSSILSQKKPETSDDTTVPAPYVHPLVKRASSLSEKSLEICTESLGSETGSDGFSYPGSDHGEEQEVDDANAVVEVVKVNYPVINKKKFNNNNNNNNNNNGGVNTGVKRSFPPPLPSLADRDDGSNLQIRTRREDGKVVVEAVAVPSRNCFRARRQNGRLLLTLANDTLDDEQDLFDDDVDDDVGDDLAFENEINVVEGNVENKLALVMEENNNRCLPTTRVINVRATTSPAMIMTKLVELTSSRNVSTWPRGSNSTVTISLEEGDEDTYRVMGKDAEVEASAARHYKKKVVLQSPRPPRPTRVSTAATAADVLNAYEYYWRRSDSPAAAAVAVLKPLAGKQNSAGTTTTTGGARAVSPQVAKDSKRIINKLLYGHNEKGVAQNEVVLVKAAAVGGEYLVPFLRGCKEPRRPLFYWEPFCIASS
ncbi:hypothetical protein vseg_004179 [Gypsophila vaccaria]